MKIGFIGFGNIAQAMAQGLIEKHENITQQMYASSYNYEKLVRNTAKYGIHPCKTNQETVDNCDLVFICVKPYQVKDVLSELSLENKIIVSLVGGKYNQDYEEIIPETHHIACLPNTAISVAEGVIVVEQTHTLTQEQLHTVHELLSTVAMLEYVETAKMNIATTISGCTPAYTAMYLEALGDAACKYGLTREVGYRLVAKMIEGTGKMARVTQKHPGILKDEVCSPKGTTIKGIASLEKDGFRGTIINAIGEVMK